MSKCKCTLAISLTGEGCRYCQPQNYINILHDTIDEEREDAIKLDAELATLKQELQALREQKPVIAAYTAAVEAKRDALKHEMNLNIIFITVRGI